MMDYEYTGITKSTGRNNEVIIGSNKNTGEANSMFESAGSTWVGVKVEPRRIKY